MISNIKLYVTIIYMSVRYDQRIIKGEVIKLPLNNREGF